ncbi:MULTISPECIES: hypothetical protein [unclassified Bradyrhizobium]|uniref:hypothetical protein n=1 Tax=unclassified Bradyrhizobium TaxID=2631580 RepID=UPI0004219CBB|nr:MULTISPECIES: hypothetical protein [unclassified Bradyrhizobium]QIG91719.1 hypothetical protein G6P99_03775 [Bradyrhizobium sp. 6(2017)]
MKKISLSIAAAIVAMTAVTAGAAELPAYEKAGLPISPVQVQLLGAAGVQQQSAVANSATPHQRSVLTPRKVTTATAPGQTETVGRSTR